MLVYQKSRGTVINQLENKMTGDWKSQILTDDRNNILRILSPVHNPNGKLKNSLNDYTDALWQYYSTTPFIL
ncbi:beta-1,3-glucanase family protein, partial [Piscirickettsia litoralis]|uniref:beta-1,3-glucanase family protein n=1 Tax=Piscirickettsia litoralis TaxID=1891921 RepID=UPI0019117750